MSSETFPERHRARMAAEKAAQEELSAASRAYVEATKDLENFVDRIAEERRAAAKTTPFKGRAPRDQPKPIPLKSHEALGLQLIPKPKMSRILIR